MQMDYKKVKELQRKLSKAEKRYVSFAEIAGSAHKSKILFHKRDKKNNTFTVSVRTLRWVSEFFQRHGLIHDYSDLLCACGSIPVARGERSAGHVDESNHKHD